MLGFHFSLFVERIPRLFPKCILILTGEMEVHGYKKKKKRKILHRSKSHRSSLPETHGAVLVGTQPSRRAALTYSPTLRGGPSGTPETRPIECPALGRPPPPRVCHFTQGCRSRPGTALPRALCTAGGRANPYELVHLRPLGHRIKALGYSRVFFFSPSTKRTKNAFKKMYMHSFFM